MRVLFSLLILASLVGATDSFLSHQAGTVITPRTWTQLPTGGWSVAAVGFEKALYSPAAGCAMLPGVYHEGNNEWQQSLDCFSYPEQRWNVLQDAAEFHDSYWSGGGHNVGQIAWMPLYNSWWFMTTGSGSNQPERPLRQFWFDPTGQIGRSKENGIAPNYQPSNGANTFVTTAMDQYHGLIVGYPNYGGNTTTYDPSANQWTVPTVSGSPPTATFLSVDYDSLDHRVYFYGGGATTISAFDAGTSTWSTITPNPDPNCSCSPTARYYVGWVFDQDDNLFFMAGGSTADQSTLYTDTWAFHVDTSTWERLTTTVPWPTTLGNGAAASFERLVYVSDSKAFVIFMPPSTGTSGQCIGTSGSSGCVLTYTYCYANCTNAGRVTNTYVPSVGYLNTSFTGSGTRPDGQVEEGSAQSTSLAVDGSNNLYAAWIESGKSFDSGDQSLRHPYVAKSINGGVSWSLLGGAWNSLGDTANTESSDVHIAATSAGVPWASWSNSPAIPGNPQLQIASWGGSSWTKTAISSRGGSGWYRGPNAITVIGTTPYVISIESTNSSSRALVLVDQCPNGTCSAMNGGGTLNGELNNLNPDCTVTNCSRAIAVSITNNGTAPYVCWVEETTNGTNSYMPVVSTPQLFCDYWTGSAWTPITGASLNVNTSNWAGPEIATTYMSGNLYAAWTERTLAGNPKLYVKQCSNITCTLIGNGINKDTTNGWPVHPSLTNDGTNLILTWEESQNVGQRQELYAQSWNGSAWTVLGPAINADPINGSVNYSSAAVTNGKPAVLWSEATPGNLRQVYAKYWNSNNWASNSLSCSISPPTLGPWTQGQSINTSLSASNCSPATWAISSGSLPSGLSLNALTGAITGTISTAGLSSPTITYDTAAQPYSITVTVVTSSGAALSGGRFSGGVITH